MKKKDMNDTKKETLVKSNLRCLPGVHDSTHIGPQINLNSINTELFTHAIEKIEC